MKALLGYGGRVDGTGRAGRAEEGGDGGAILSARRGLDAAGNVDHPGPDSGDPFGHVPGSQAAGQDETGYGQGWPAIEDRRGDRRTRAPGLAVDKRVDQDLVRLTAHRLGSSQVVGHPRPARGTAESKGPDDSESVSLYCCA